MGDHPVILFDGGCRLCNGAVRFVRKRDRRAVFRFEALESEGAAARLAALGVAREDLPDSLVLIESARVRLRSTAALRIARRMPFPWPLLCALFLVPRPVRDWAYDLIARHRRAG